LAGVLGQAGGFALGKLRPELLWDDIGILAHGIHYADIKSVECGPGVLSHNAVLVQTSHLLKSQDCVLGGLPENPVHSHRGDVIIKLRHHREKVLYYLDIFSGVAEGNGIGAVDGHQGGVEGLTLADQLRQFQNAHVQKDQLIPGGLSHHAV